MRKYTTLVLLLLLTACGGGGGGGSTAPATVAPSSSNSYFPSSSDTEWYYSNSNTKTYATTTAINGNTAQVLNYPIGSKEYFQVSENEIGLVGLYTPSIYIGGVGNFQVEFKFNQPLKLMGGNGSTNLKTTGSANINPTYGTTSISVQGSSTILGSEQISVPYGSFTAIHVQFDLTMSATIDGYDFSIPWQAELWFAKDVGIIRRTEQGQTINLTQFVGGKDNNIALEEPLTLFIPDNGVALTKFPTVDKLSHSVDILDSYGQNDINWRATTEADWLAITSSGITGEPLVINADTTNLAKDSFYQADIVVTSDNSEIKSHKNIRVGLWIGSTDPSNQSTLAGSFNHLATDPVRPYLYVSNSSTKSDHIDIYHLYTQSHIGSLNADKSYSFGHMEVSDDGRFLYAGADNYKVAVFDLENRQLVTTWRGSGGIADNFTLAKPSDFQLLIDKFGMIYRASDGVSYAQATEFSNLITNELSLGASQYGNRFCYLDQGLSPSTLGCFTLDYNSIRNKVSVEAVSQVIYGAGSNGRDIALNKNGSTAYLANGAPYEFVVVDIDNMTITGSLPAEAYPVAVQVGPSDEVHGLIDNTFGPYNLWVYEKDHSERLKTYTAANSGNLSSSSLVVSGDGMLSIVSGQDQVVMISSYAGSK